MKKAVLGLLLWAMWASTAGAAVSFVSVGAIETAGNTSATANIPTGSITNDVWIAEFQAAGQGGSQTFTPPAGWTLVPGTNNSFVGAGIQSTFWYIVYTGSNPALGWSWTPNGLSGAHTLRIWAFRGEDTSTPIDGNMSQGTDNNTGGVTSIPLTPTISGDMLMFALAGNPGHSSETITGSPALTAAYTGGAFGTVMNYGEYLSLSGVGPTTAYAVSDSSIYMIASQLLIKAAAATATPTPTPTPTPTASPTPTPIAPTASPTNTPTVCTQFFPSCVLVTNGIAFTPTPGIQDPSVTEERPPPFTATYPDSFECCSVIYPGRLCQYQSATCIYVSPYVPQ